MEVGSPLGVMYQPRGVANQVDLDVLITIGARASPIQEQVGDDHTLAVQYKVLHDVGRKTDPIRVLGNHVSVLLD